MTWRALLPAITWATLAAIAAAFLWAEVLR